MDYTLMPDVASYSSSPDEKANNEFRQARLAFLYSVLGGIENGAPEAETMASPVAEQSIASMESDTPAFVTSHSVHVNDAMETTATLNDNDREADWNMAKILSHHPWLLPSPKKTAKTIAQPISVQTVTQSVDIAHTTIYTSVDSFATGDEDAGGGVQCQTTSSITTSTTTSSASTSTTTAIAENADAPSKEEILPAGDFVVKKFKQKKHLKASARQLKVDRQQRDEAAFQQAQVRNQGLSLHGSGLPLQLSKSLPSNTQMTLADPRNNADRHKQTEPIETDRHIDSHYDLPALHRSPPSGLFAPRARYAPAVALSPVNNQQSRSPPATCRSEFIHNALHRDLRSSEGSITTVKRRALSNEEREEKVRRLERLEKRPQSPTLSPAQAIDLYQSTSPLTFVAQSDHKAGDGSDPSDMDIEPNAQAMQSYDDRRDVASQLPANNAMQDRAATASPVTRTEGSR